MLQSLALKALQHLPPETAHALTLRAVHHGWLPHQPAGQPFRLGRILRPLAGRIGLAGGTDKNGTALAGWPEVGYGFAEIGTVTFHPHPGNLGPRGQPVRRLWRLPGQPGLVNWLGLPNQGHRQVYANLAAFRQTGLGKVFCVGVSLQSLDKDRDLTTACKHMRIMAEAFSDVADFLTLNASCPNVAGHGDGAAELAKHVALLKAMLPEFIPVLVKLGPTLDHDSLCHAADAYLQAGAHGFIACNTVRHADQHLLTENNRPAPWPLNAYGKPEGGYSGPGLWPVSSFMVRTLRDHLGPAVPLIQVGGIDGGHRALEAIHTNGADTVQMYTAPTSGGAGLLAHTNGFLAAHLS